MSPSLARLYLPLLVVLPVFTTACSDADPAVAVMAGGGGLEAAITATQPYADDTMNFAMGFDTVKGASTGAVCVTGQGTPVCTAGACGFETYYSLDLVESVSKLRESLDIAASASLSTPGLSGSLRLQFASKFSQSRYSSFLLARVSVRKAALKIQPTELKPEWLRLYLNEPQRFAETCGNMFISAITPGGEYFVVFELDHEVSDKQQNFQAEIKASGSLGMWSAEAKMESALSQFKDNKHLKIYSLQVGGDAHGSILPVDLAQVMEKVRTFPTVLEGNNSRGLSATLTSYDAVYAGPMPSELDWRAQELYVQTVNTLYTQNLSAIFDRQYALDNGYQFFPYNENALRSDIVLLSNTNATLLAYASSCKNDYRKCSGVQQPLPDVTLSSLPTRRTAAQLGPVTSVLDAKNLVEQAAAATEQDVDYCTNLRLGVRCGPTGQTTLTVLDGRLAALTRRQQNSAVQLNKVREEYLSFPGGQSILAKAEKATLRIEDAMRVLHGVVDSAHAEVNQPYAVFNEGHDAVCGVESYREAAGPECGVDHYNSGTDGNICGYSFNRYTRRTESPCGVNRAPECNGGDAVVHTKTVMKKCGRADVEEDTTLTCQHATPNTCANPAFGTVYRSCRDAGHGVERYNACRDPAFGVERLLPCTSAPEPTVAAPLLLDKKWTRGFGSASGEWSSFDRAPRVLADVDGDGDLDVIGFAPTGTYVGRSDGTSFEPETLWLAEFGSSAGGWSSYSQNPRAAADVDGDGNADVVGFGADSIKVALSTGAAFGAPAVWGQSFTAAQGWTSFESTPRFLADVNGDHRADIVGLTNDGVYVSLSTGRAFAAPTRWSIDFATAQGWPGFNSAPSALGDVDGDGKADLVGFGGDGPWVALSTGTAFAATQRWSTHFGRWNGWRTQSRQPRSLADVNGDGKADIVGFRGDGVWVALSTGTAFTDAAPYIAAYGETQGWPTFDASPRLVGDVNGDRLADVVGYAGDGVVVSRALRGRFGR